jgi:hypothetical protein
MLGYNLFKLRLHYLSTRLEGMGSLRVDKIKPPVTYAGFKTPADH